MMKPPYNVETLVVLQPIGVDTDAMIVTGCS